MNPTMPSTIQKMSVLIATYNREQPLVNTLECAFKQDHPNYEIIVVDQTKFHEPEVQKFLEANQTKFKWIRASFASVTKARNVAIANATGEHLLFTDDDVTYDSSFLRKHQAALDAGHDLVAGRVLEVQSRIAKAPAWINRFGQFSGGDTGTTSGPTNMATGCNFSFKRRVLEKVPSFDENYFGNATHEDTDFTHRVWQAGYDCYFSAEAELFHHKAPTGGVRVYNLYLNESVIRNKFYFYKKNFPFYVSLFQNARLITKGVRHYFKTYGRARKEARAALRSLASGK